MSLAAFNLAEQIGPFLPLIGVLLGGLIVGAFAVYNRRKGNLEIKVPSVAEVWAKQVEQGDKLDKEIGLRRTSDLKVEDLGRMLRVSERRVDTYTIAFQGMRDAFKAYAERVQKGGSNALTAKEKASLNLPVDVEDTQWHTWDRRASNPPMKEQP